MDVIAMVGNVVPSLVPLVQEGNAADNALGAFFFCGILLLMAAAYWVSIPRRR